MNFKIEVIASSNMVFTTRLTATAYGHLMFDNEPLVSSWRVVETDQPATHWTTEPQAVLNSQVILKGRSGGTYPVPCVFATSDEARKYGGTLVGCLAIVDSGPCPELIEVAAVLVDDTTAPVTARLTATGSVERV